LECPAGHIGRGAKPVSPKFVTQHCDAITIRHSVLVLAEETAERRRHSEHSEEVRRDHGAVDEPGLLIGSYEERGVGAVRGKTAQRFGLVAKMNVVAITDPTASPPLLPSGLYEDNFIRAIHGKIAEEERVGEGKHRGDR